MEPENTHQEVEQTKEVSQLHEVTPLSKYLAMALFIILPFLGGWIGYTYAPEKVVEVEKEVIREVVVEKNVGEEVQSHAGSDGNVEEVILPNIFDPETVVVGEKYGAMEIEVISSFSSKDDLEPERPSDANIYGAFVGEVVLEGTYIENEGMGPPYYIENLDEESLLKLPRSDSDTRGVLFGIRNSEILHNFSIESGDKVSVTIDRYYYVAYPAGVYDSANVLDIEKIE